MSIFSEKNFTRWIVILPVVGIILTAFMLVLLEISQIKSNLDDRFLEVRSNFITLHKEDAKNRVLNMVTYIKSSKDMKEYEVKQEVKEEVDFAISTIKSIYLENLYSSKDEIIAKIRSKLIDIRFWDGTGYFFMYDMEGNCLLLPHSPQLEGTNLLGLQDLKGKFTIKDMISIVKRQGEGFESWWWYKPSEQLMKEKLGYVKSFEQLGIFVGTARYKEDIAAEAKNSIERHFLNDFVARNDENILIVGLDGESIVENNNSITKSEALQVRQGMKYAEEGFFLNRMEFSEESLETVLENSILYAYYIADFDWIVGVNIHKKDMIKSVNEIKEKIQDNFNKIVKEKILFSPVIVFFMLLPALVLANRLKKVLKRYKRSLEQKNLETLKQKDILHHSSRHDYLTSLPNRILLNDRLKQAIKQAKRDDKRVAIMFIDIDKFKDINDSIGHDAGDMILKEAALRFRASIRECDTVARFGGDEFVILVDDFKNLHDIVTVINKIQKAFLDPVKISGSSHQVTLSIGVSIFPEDGDTASEILKNADIAMYKAKGEGRDCYRFFTAQMNTDIQKHMQVKKELRSAVENREFVLHYQPLVQAKSGKIQGVEALVRWNHPTKGIIFPDQFIDIAEESSIIIGVGSLILEEAMRQMVQWKAKGYTLNKMAINIAARQLEDRGFIGALKALLEKTSCKPEWIELEIVERYAMKDIDESLVVLNELRKLDVGVALDDFGTGYSSLAYLRKLPITKLKIDRAFVKNIITSYEDRAIAESIIALASGLRLKVLAEGVEEKEERDFLVFGGCDEIQGYLFSKPLPASEVGKLLEKGVCNVVP